MISCNNGKVVIKGNRTSVMAELSTLVYALASDCNVDKDEIIRDVSFALKAAETTEKFEDTLKDDDRLSKILKELWK